MPGKDLRIKFTLQDDRLWWYRGKVVKVTDGDTIWILIDLGHRGMYQTDYRLFGLDTPEIHGVKKGSEEYLNGMTAALAVVDKALGKEVMVRTKKGTKGKYGRFLAERVEIDGEDLNTWLIKTGYAEEKSY